jgi:alpha-1,2-mannosyltransferase
VQAKTSSRGASFARAFLVCGVAVAVLGMLVFWFGAVSRAARNAYPYDFNVNWIGAQRLIDGQALYDRAASAAQAADSLGHYMKRSGHGPFVSFIGPPSTALLHVPFLALSHSAAVVWFRILAVVGMIASLAITARLLPLGARLGGFLLAFGAFLVSFALADTIALAQGHEFVMLGLALGIWGAIRKRWAVSGIGLGFATVLKISPVLLLIYLIIRGIKRPAYWAAGTAIVFSLAATLVGRPTELWIWLRDVAPEVGRGSLQVFNQSVVGWLARLSANGDANLAVQSVLDRGWQLVAYLVGAILVIALWKRRRHRDLLPLELGIVILIALAVGPLSWEHYLVWAFIPLTLCFDPTLWSGRTRNEITLLLGGLAAGTYLYSIPLQTVWNATRGTTWLPWMTSPGTLGTIAYLTVALRLITRRAVPAEITDESGHEALVDDDAAAIPTVFVHRSAAAT